MKPIRLHPEAARELLDASRWYAYRSASAGAGFAREVDRAFDAISDSPESWPRMTGQLRRYVVARVPCVIIYRIRQDDVEVIAVAHQRQRPGYWRSR